MTTVGVHTTAALEKRLRGPLLRPGDAGFDEATLLWNGMVEKTPALVVRALDTADVIAAVDFAREHEVPLSVRGGGHNIAGTALADGGLTIDLSQLREVTVDPEQRIATVQPGCVLGDVDRATQRHGLATPLGFVSQVGVSGLTLGGGLGYLTRRFGWTVDNLIEAEIVTADGLVRRASRDESADLFWGIRGAGANLGVVTELRLRLHEVGPTVYGGLIAWPFERAAGILEAYRTLTVEAPRELAVWLILLRAPAAPFVPPRWHGQLVCAMAVCYSGDLGQVDAVLAPIRELGEPVVDLLAEQPYVQIQSYLDETEPKGSHYYWKTEYLTELHDELLVAVRELAAECPIPCAEIGFLHLAGALNERAEDDGALGNRDARYVLGVNGMWAPGELDGEEARRWIPAAWRQATPSPPAAPTSTSRPTTRTRTASGRRTAPTSTGFSRSSSGTTPATCSARTATSLLPARGARPSRACPRERPRTHSLPLTLDVPDVGTASATRSQVGTAWAARSQPPSGARRRHIA